MWAGDPCQPHHLHPGACEKCRRSGLSQVPSSVPGTSTPEKPAPHCLPELLPRPELPLPTAMARGMRNLYWLPSLSHLTSLPHQCHMHSPSKRRHTTKIKISWNFKRLRLVQRSELLRKRQHWRCALHGQREGMRGRRWRKSSSKDVKMQKGRKSISAWV